MTAADLLKRCRAAGLTLQREGDGLAVLGPEHLLSPDLVAALRTHKRAILAALDLEALPPDCRPWVGVARRVLRGEFDEGPRCAWQSLWIGCRAVNHPDCLAARARLEKLLGRQPRT